MRKGLTVLLSVLFLVYSLPLWAQEGVSFLPKEGRRITLSEGLKAVLRDNRLVKIALMDNEMAREDALVARSALLPRINLFAGRTFLRFQPAAKSGSLETPTAQKEYTSYGFDVYQTIFDFGKSLFNYGGGRDLLEARKANTESVKRIACLEFIVSYFNLLESGRMVEVAEKEVESLNAYLNDVEQLYKQGSAVENDLLPAKVKLADARQRLISLKNAKELARASLNNILSLPLRENTQAADLEMPEPAFPDIEEAWRSAETQRPELLFYSKQIKASLAFERARAVENFPELFVDGGYNYTENKFMTHQDNFSLGFGARMDLYDGGSSRALFLKERAHQRQLNEQKDKISEDIKFEIEASFLGLKDASEKRTVAFGVLKQAEENVRFYRSKYNAGSSTPTEVLEAIALQTAARTNYYNADYEVKRGYAKLMYSMGIDLSLIYEGMESRKNGR